MKPFLPLLMAFWMVLNQPLQAEIHLTDSLKRERHLYVEVKGQLGKNLYTGYHLDDILSHGYHAGELRLGWQTFKANSWASTQHYPSYGIGLYSGYLGDRKVIGYPSSLFGFLSLPWNHGHRFTFHSELAMGFAYGMKPYDSVSNPLNDAIGSKVAVYFNLNTGFKYRMSNHLDLVGGVGLTHISNGRTKTPNYGLNMIGLNLGLRYYVNRPELKIFRKPSLMMHNEWRIMTTIGTTQNDPDEGTKVRYLNASINADYMHMITEKKSVGYGFDYFYDGSVPNPNFDHNSYIGMHAAYSYHVWHFSMGMQVGTYLRQGSLDKGLFYLGPNFRYNLSKRYFAQLTLKTFDGAAADVIEYGFGIRLQKVKKRLN